MLAPILSLLVLALPNEVHAHSEQPRILIAIVDLLPGHPVGKNSVASRHRISPPTDALHTSEQAHNRRAKRFIRRGDVIRDSDLGPKLKGVVFLGNGEGPQLLPIPCPLAREWFQVGQLVDIHLESEEGEWSSIVDGVEVREVTDEGVSVYADFKQCMRLQTIYVKEPKRRATPTVVSSLRQHVVPDHDGGSKGP